MKNPFNFEAEAFEFDDFEEGIYSKPCRCNQHSREEAEMFDEYEAEESDLYSEFNEEYESDSEGEPFEFDYEYDEAYETGKGPDCVDVGPGRCICGFVYRDFKAWYDTLSDLWRELYTKGSKTADIKKARVALYNEMNRIINRLKSGWYERKGCKAVDFEFLKSKTFMTDKELKADSGVQAMSKKLALAADVALNRFKRASSKRRPVRRSQP